MRLKTLLFASAFALLAVSARAQVLTQTTIVTSRPGVVLGAPVVAAPIYPTTTVVSPYSVVSPVVVRRRVVVAPTVLGAPAVVARPIVPGPVVVSPVVPVVRRGWGVGPGFGYGFGPRPWGRRGW